MAENILITVCARAGSKRLPNKNILPIHGKPLIAWTVERALKFGKGDIVICADDIGIEIEACHYGADFFLNRPEHLSQDYTPKIDTLRHALKESEIIFEKQFQIIIDLDVTNPLRTPQDIENAYQTFIKGKYDSLTSVTKARHNPRFNMLKVIDGKAQYYDDNQGITRSQDAPLVYAENSCINIFTRDYLLDGNNVQNISDNNTGVFIMEPWQGYHIDDAVDFKIVEFLMKEGHIA